MRNFVLTLGLIFQCLMFSFHFHSHPVGTIRFVPELLRGLSSRVKEKHLSLLSELIPWPGCFRMRRFKNLCPHPPVSPRPRPSSSGLSMRLLACHMVWVCAPASAEQERGVQTTREQCLLGCGLGSFSHVCLARQVRASLSGSKEEGCSV